MCLMDECLTHRFFYPISVRFCSIWLSHRIVSRRYHLSSYRVLPVYRYRLSSEVVVHLSSSFRRLNIFNRMSPVKVVELIGCRKTADVTSTV
jgi:hypothetical protein